MDEDHALDEQELLDEHEHGADGRVEAVDCIRSADGTALERIEPGPLAQGLVEPTFRVAEDQAAVAAALEAEVRSAEREGALEISALALAAPDPRVLEAQAEFAQAAEGLGPSERAALKEDMLGPRGWED